MGTMDQADTWEYGQVLRGLWGQGRCRHLAIRSGLEGFVETRDQADTWQYGQVVRGLWGPG